MAQYGTLQATTYSSLSKNITNLTIPNLIYTGAGVALGLVINSHTAGTIKVYDGITAAGTVLFNTITFNAGEHFIPFYGARFYTGLFVTVGGTADLTILYNV